MKGTKYLLLITVVLFALVFAITSLIGRDKSEKADEEKTKSNKNTSVSTTVSTEEIITTIPEEDNVNIDNIWAMFLVNNQNPLPSDYDNMIETTKVFEDYRDYYMDSRMSDYVIRMIDDAKKEGLDLLMVSAYRTIEYQQNNFDKSLKDRMDSGMDYEAAYVDTSANVAFPGKSEHNAGLAADIMCPEYTSMDDAGFEDTPEFKWLSEHAHEYGFILRYPNGKSDYTGIIYEPWHYRFVGVYYAKELKELDMCLEEYYEHRGWLDDKGTAIYMRGPVEEISDVKPVFDNSNPASPAGETGTDEGGTSAETTVPTESKTKASTTKRREQSVTIIV